MLIVPLQPIKLFLLVIAKTTKAYSELPDFAENLAANTFATRLATGHNTLGGRHDGDAKTTLNATDLITAEVHTAAGTRYALQITDDSLIVWAVLQVNAENLHAILFGRLVVRDVAFFLEDAGNLGLELGCGTSSFW
jgi:hypothetical protein